ncbi:MAG: nucleotidyltransferase family protein [Thermofilaceae archaeon]
MGARRVKGAVLCGGTGSRLRPLTYYFQKTMIPIGLKQKPLLEYVIRLMKYHGIVDVALLVNYKAEQIMNYFDDGSRFGVRLEYVHDDPNYRGNGGALLNASRRGVFSGFDDVLIYYGDILTNLDLTDMLRVHREKGAAATLALSTNYTVSVGVAEVAGTKIVSLREKPPLGKPVVIGVLAVKTEVLKILEELAKPLQELDLMQHFIPQLIERGYHVEGYLTDAFWYDVGSTERYEKLDPHVVDEVLGFLLA